MKYPVEKYTVIVHQHPEYCGVETIAFSTYAGKVVYGKAICRDGDNYDEAYGRDLAIARCAAKIAKKRAARAERLLRDAERQSIEAKRYMDKMKRYALDATAEVAETGAEVEKLLNERV